MKTKVITIAVFAGIATASPVAQDGQETVTLDQASTTTTITIDLAGIESWDLQGDGDNFNEFFNIGAGAQILGFGWDVTITTISPSWLSEVNIALTNSDGSDGLVFAPGIGHDFGGTQSFSSGGKIDLTSIGEDFALNADGILHLEVFESFDDYADDIDAFFEAGSTMSIVFKPVPAPGALGLLGLGGLVATRRRR